MPRVHVDRRLVKVRAGARGSGWALGSCGVLTGRHVVEPFLDRGHPDCLVVPGDGRAGAFACTVLWDERELDLAVLVIAEPMRAAWRGTVGSGSGAALAEIGLVEVIADAVGFPDAVVDQDVAHPELAPGRLLPAGGALSGLVPFDVDSSVPDDFRLWRGMSGAVVRDRDGGRLRGVVVRVDEDRQQRFVSAARA